MGGEDGFHLDRALSRLRTVGFIDDDGVAAVGELAGVFGDEGEFLEDGDDDGDAAGQGVGELLGVFVDFLNDALLVLELVDGFLKLLVEHEAVCDDDDGIEDFAVLGVVQGGEMVGEPGDGIAFAAAGGVLNEVLVAGAVGDGVGDELADGIDLMEAGKDEGLGADLLAVLGPLLGFEV